MLVDDHALLRDALALLLTQRFPHAEFRGAGSLAQARSALATQPADILLIDLDLPDAKGIEALLALREEVPQARAVVVSADDRAETVYAALDAGAAGFLHKATDSVEFADAIQFVMEGGVALPLSFVGRPAAAPTSYAALGLSRRQWEVLRLVLQGKPNKLVCRELDLSASTVKTHLSEIYRRLGVRSRTQAMVEVARRGIKDDV
ncbi:response regulator [Cupriavidus sp. 30B13]|uniref:response regulator n=1 Tax=Cupriavidus sp. 30B13 TaxID=3384241 RepID=UPI003B90EF82